MPSEINECPFCNSKILESTFSESENFRAIVNIAPVLPGHSLVVPKRHITSFMELTDDELYEMMKLSREVIKILNKTYKTDAFNWTIQEKEEAGQSVAHLHLHVIPRKAKDLEDPGDWYQMVKDNYKDIIDSASRKRLTKEEIRQEVKKLKAATKII